MPFTPSQLVAFRDQYHTTGLVIVDGLIPPSLLEPLRAAADTVTELGRRGEWKDVRVVGKQFPPFPPGEDIWGVQHIMHPDLNSPIFAQWYGSDDLLDVSASLMNCSREDMQLELFGLLVNPLEKDFALSWHRDDIKADVSPEEEADRLKVKHWGVQWNCALYDDDCLLAIPASHNRVRTPLERSANLSPPEDEIPMPGGQVVRLLAGQCAFYNNDIVHKGKYNLKVKRRTLHGSYGHPPEGDTSRATNILQHDLSYTSSPLFASTLPPSLVPLLAKLERMKALVGEEGVGFSQDL